MARIILCCLSSYILFFVQYSIQYSIPVQQYLVYAKQQLIQLYTWCYTPCSSLAALVTFFRGQRVNPLACSGGGAAGTHKDRFLCFVPYVSVCLSVSLPICLEVLGRVSVCLSLCLSVDIAPFLAFVLYVVPPPLSMYPPRRACLSSVRNNQTNERGRILRCSHATAQPGAGLVPGAARVSQTSGNIDPPTHTPT